MITVISSPFIWLYRGSCAVLFYWLGVEAVIAYGGATRRRRIGLCGAMMCNRFFLFSLAAITLATVEVVDAYDNAIFALTGNWFPPMDYLLGVIECSSVAMFWLVFLPPRFYRNWIESHDKQPERIA